MKYFGTDGIRGIVNKDLTIELLMKIGKTLRVLNIDKIYIGYDTRESSQLVLFSIVSGLLSQGIDVIDVGIVSTPAMQYYSNKHQVVTLMITASHNPYYYNGIKIFKNGEKLTKDEEELIECNLDNNEYEYKLGKYHQSKCIFNEYLEYIFKYKTNSLNKVILDLSNGALVNIASELFKDDHNITLINKDYNGTNINDKCGSLFIYETSLNDNDYLFSFDGDGDRILFKDKKRVYDGDLIVYLLAKYYKLDKVVVTENVNLGLLKAFEKDKIQVYISSVGDKNVYDLMIKENIKIGGETSGHIINLDYMNSGDGILNFLIINKILNEINIHKYLKNIRYYPSKNLNLNSNYSFNNLLEIKNKYLDKARINIRRSGTENVIRVNICAKKEEIVDKIIKEIQNNEQYN